MAQITTNETIRACPLCGESDFVKDYKREETYCNNCGVVISSAVTYVGLERCHFPRPHSAPSEARQYVHLTWKHKDDIGKYDNRNTTNYRHNIPNRLLMVRGKRKY